MSSTPRQETHTPGSGAVRVPRSPTGRIPKWALDEAMGVAPQPTAWRAAPQPLQLSPGRATGRGTRRRDVLWGVVAVAVAIAALLALGPTSGWPHRALPSPQASLPPAGHEEHAATHPPATTAGSAGDHRFLALQDDGSPVTFSPCRPIHYVVRPDHAPPNGSRMIAAAIAEVSRATGLRFVADGSTDEPLRQDRDAYQPDRYGKRWAPVLIAWATEDVEPDFGVDIAGEAGPQRVARPGGDLTYVTGTVLLDPAALSAMSRDFGEPVARSVILHELGHLVGLSHVKDGTQIMFPRVQPDVVTFGVGDRRGLAALGSGSCVPDL
jgi:hypothetical protein